MRWVTEFGVVGEMDGGEGHSRAVDRRVCLGLRGRVRRVHSWSWSFVVLRCVLEIEPVAQMEESYVLSLRRAVKDCSDRGLYYASKW